MSWIPKGEREHLNYRKTPLGSNYCACKIIKIFISFQLDTYPHAVGQWCASCCSIGLEEEAAGPRDAATSSSKGFSNPKQSKSQQQA